METPPSPYTGSPGGGGTLERERTRSARSHDLLRHRAARSRDTDSANTHGIRTFLAYIHGRPIKGHDDRFSLIARLILIVKGYT